MTPVSVPAGLCQEAPALPGGVQSTEGLFLCGGKGLHPQVWPRGIGGAAVCAGRPQPCFAMCLQALARGRGAGEGAPAPLPWPPWPQLLSTPLSHTAVPTRPSPCLAQLLPAAPLLLR